MTDGRARLSTTALYLIVSVLFWVPLVGGVLGFPLSIATMTTSDKPLVVHAVVPTSEVGDTPPGTELADPVPVVVPIADVTVAQIIVFHLGFAIAALAYLYGAWQLREVVRSIRDGDTFVSSNVRRLRVLGALFLFGYPVFQWVGEAWNEWVLATAGPPGTIARVSVELLAAPAVLGGLSLLVLAEVFAHGIVLREDVEATV